jgi:hypothetical protein
LIFIIFFQGDYNLLIYLIMIFGKDSDSSSSSDENENQEEEEQQQSKMAFDMLPQSKLIQI